MLHQFDSSTCDLANIRLKLTDDLRFVPQQYEFEVFYHIEQPSRSRFFRIGWAEYALLSLFDGKATLGHVLGQAAGVLGQEAFTEPEAISICRWLIDNDLAYPVESNRPLEDSTPLRGPSRILRFNPFWIKIPLCRPDRVFQWLEPWLGWLHSWPILLCSVFLWAFALGSILWHGEKFAQSSRGVLAPSNLFWLGAAWIGLKVIHELNHAVVCKRYGGSVPEMGIIWVLVAPLAYVDVTSSWSFRSRWKRMHVAAAGMMAEFHIASVCALWWMQTNSLVVQDVLFTVLFMASLTTVLFNANPLMRFDGYYLMSDWLKIPNLYSRGFEYWKELLSQWLLGRSKRQAGWRGWKGWSIKIYGLLALGWRVVVGIGLIVTASILCHGAGLVLAAFAVFCWLCLPVGSALLLFGRQARRQPMLLFRGAVSLGLLLGLGLLCWRTIPWPGVRQAHGITEYAPLTVVRAEVPGFVEEIFVEDGQSVQPGMVLARLRNDELETRWQELKFAIEQSAIKRRAHLNEGEIAMAQVEQQNSEALKKRHLELQHQRDRLVVRAPIAGHVLARDLPRLYGSYLQEGHPLLEIGETGRLELRIAIPQPDISTFRARAGKTVPIRLCTGHVLEGELTMLAPRATLAPPHLALCAPTGGPLAVTAHVQESKTDQTQLTEPHLPGTVTISETDSRHVQAGRLGAVSLRQKDETLGRVAYRQFKYWLIGYRTLLQKDQTNQSL